MSTVVYTKIQLEIVEFYKSCCLWLNLNMIARGFNVITKEIFKALSSSHDYKCGYK